ncbi:recombinase family protein [Saccharothrix saharensis]|uniref:recombinase family protein n=1 Tax=Saccharothrix saharensis TaxID=571190 RepID=UPI001152DFD0|nr:recombinase family protein [Saccharothrix saharensis]
MTVTAEPTEEPPTPTDPLERVVYGYLRSDAATEAELAALRAEMIQFCQERGLRLANVFTDRGSRSDQVTRPGVGGLLQALVLRNETAVIVPALDHLSDQSAVQAQLRRLIQRAGSTVVVIHEVDDGTKTDGM